MAQFGLTLLPPPSPFEAPPQDVPVRKTSMGSSSNGVERESPSATQSKRPVSESHFSVSGYFCLTISCHSISKVDSSATTTTVAGVPEGQKCLGCGATATPEWRRGPLGE